MPLLPIPVGFSKNQTCHNWSIVRHLIEDRPLPYVVDPDIDLTYYVQANGHLAVQFARLGHVFCSRSTLLSIVPEFCSLDRGRDGDALIAADDGTSGPFCATAHLLCCTALATAFFRYRQLAPDNVRARIDQNLYANAWETLGHHLYHFTGRLAPNTERD